MRDHLKTRAKLIAEAEPTLDSARRLATVMDDAVRALARAARSASGIRFALVALGGWGAGALLPSSDLDLLVLSDAPPDRLKPLVEELLYPLWDSGLKVGHQVRSPREQLKACRADLATCTATLTARPIVGDAEWAASVIDDVARDARKRSRALLAELAERPRPGTPFVLEPELKEGAGGRRDFDELVWTAAVVSGSRCDDPAPLVDAGLLTAEELALVRTAAETTAAARFELARAGEGGRLTLEGASALERTDAEQLQAALADTALVLERVRARAARRTRTTDAAPAPLTAAEALGLLGGGEASLHALETAAWEGRLDALVPGFRALMAMRRPGLGHELTVGAHCLRCACLAATPPAPGTALERSRTAITDPSVLLVAALVHDVGKAVPGPGHAERGVVPAREAAERFGLSPEAAADVADLVALHLELAETAARVDLDDEDAILRAAARVRRRELLAPLHLLTAADSSATGPATWSAWTATLVGHLVARLDTALSDAVDGAGIAAAGEAVRAAALAELSRSLDAERAFAEIAPVRYLAGRQPGDVVRDAHLLAELSASPAATFKLAVTPGPLPDTHALTIAAFDRSELLARLAGAISLAGLDILSLDAYGAPGGIALDSFVVTSATLRPVTPETFAKLERLLDAALRDRLELRTRLAERARHYPPRSAAAVDVKVVSEGWDTAVRVKAPDRPGLLHDLARAVSGDGLDIRWAKVLTVDGVAIDTFHVVGPDGGAVDDDGVLGHLVMRLRESA